MSGFLVEIISQRFTPFNGKLYQVFPIRDENPTHSFPALTVLLILMNVAVFFYEVSLGRYVEAFIETYALIPVEFWSEGYSLRPFLTSMFLHGGFGHIFGNMWFLWIFGDNLEDLLGKGRYLVFYLATGMVAGLVHAFLNADSPVPTVGASGAISGILGGYIVLHPKIRVKTIVTLGFFWNVVYLPAIFFLGLWFVMQLLGGLGGPSGVAFGAHIGGFVAGVVLMYVLTKPTRYPPTHRYDSGRVPRF